MKKEELYKLYKDSFSRELSPEEVNQLEEVAEEYPFFALPRVLQCRQEEDLTQLEKNISFVSNRSLFRDFLHSKLYFTDTETKPYMEENPGRKRFRVLFPPHPFDHFAILGDLGKPSSDMGSSPLLSLSQPMPTSYHLAFLDHMVEEKAVKYADLVPSLRKELRGGLKKDARKHRKTVEADQMVSEFLEQLPNIAPVLPTDLDGEREEHEAASRSIQTEGDEFATETLAKLHLQQNNKEEAIRIYEILRLRFPEKSAYFEAQLRKLKQ